jgi:pyridoxamine 5'-phosphate oxidase
MTAQYEDLDSILSMAWQLLKEGVRSAGSVYHVINVATVSNGLIPRVRSVVLRGFDETSRTLRFHTDARSEKAREIRMSGSVAVHLYAKDAKIQIRMLCRAQLHHDDAITCEAWRSMKDMSRRCYSQVEAPGTVVTSPQSVTFGREIDGDKAYGNFAAVVAKIETLEWLYLSATGYRRALFDWRNDSDKRAWLAP